MNWGAICGITFLSILMVMFEWPKINRTQRKEKAALLALTAIGWMLSMLFVFYPELPSPTQWVETMFKPLGRLLER